MVTVVGVFERAGTAARAIRDLRIVKAGVRAVLLLRPGAGQDQLLEIPAAPSEPPGMAQSMAAFVAGALGVAGGLALGAAAAERVLPGAGAALVVGLLGAAVLGVAGVAGGSLAGKRIGSKTFEGLPVDEFFVYKDALRQSRWIVLCLAEKPGSADEARRVLEREGAESMDAARAMWWLGLVDSALLHYRAPVPRIVVRKDPFRKGYEAALNPEFRGKPWDQVVYLLAERYGNWYDDQFRRGFDGGQQHYQALVHAR
ncbi:MAG TPA: hypothetical protein VMG35_18560 [Bryobacteraceae bacterium]|nr:hypothetical protein [Bryobacteraceae bacterium]